MATPFGNVIRQARKARGLTQAQIAAHFGITKNAVTAWETSESGPQRDRLPQIAEKLGIDIAAAMLGELVFTDIPDQVEVEPSKVNARQPQQETAIDLRRFKGPRDVPVHGTGAGGSDGDFRFNGQTIDHAPRPPGIQDKHDVYVVYVVGESMVPRFEDGDPVYVDPKRPPKAGDYVVVELHGPSEGEPGDGFVKRLVRRGAKVVVEQFNPPKSLEWPSDQVRAIHRIIPWVELMGI